MLSASTFVFLSALIYSTHCDNVLPPYISPCTFIDPNLEECIRQRITTALPLFTKGIPNLGVPSIDPVQLDDIYIGGNGLNLTFTQAAMHGLGNSELSKLKVKLGDKRETFDLAFRSNMSLTAKYFADGRILILPIQGEGDALVTAKNVEVFIESVLTHVTDGKGEHLKLSTPTYKYTIEKTTFDLKNLFNGNKQLADSTLQFANENWQQLMDELAPPAIKQIVKTVIKAINKFFSSLTIQQIIKGYNARR